MYSSLVKTFSEVLDENVSLRLSWTPSQIINKVKENYRWNAHTIIKKQKKSLVLIHLCSVIKIGGEWGIDENKMTQYLLK